jgi:protein subunit release factor A
LQISSRKSKKDMEEIDPKDIHLEGYPKRIKGGQTTGKMPVGIRLKYPKNGAYVDIAINTERSQMKNRDKALALLELAMDARVRSREDEARGSQ